MKKLLFCILLVFASISYGQEHIPNYLMVVLKDIEPVNAWCYKYPYYDHCEIASSGANGVYILSRNQNADWPEWYVNRDDRGWSMRWPGWPGSDPLITDKAYGIKIVVKLVDEELSVTVDTLDNPDASFGRFFLGSEATQDCNAFPTNDQFECFCCSSGWMYIGWWTAGINGTAQISEIPIPTSPFGLYAKAVGEVEEVNTSLLKDLAVLFADFWLSENQF